MKVYRAPTLPACCWTRRSRAASVALLLTRLMQISCYWDIGGLELKRTQRRYGLFSS